MTLPLSVLAYHKSFREARCLPPEAILPALLFRQLLPAANGS